MKFNCKDCGEFTSSKVYYTCPAKADCPKCGECVEEDGGINFKPLIEGRVPTPWLFENAHNVSEEDFYDQSLSEDDLKKVLVKK